MKNIFRIGARDSKAWRGMLFMYWRSKKLYRTRSHRTSLAETTVSIFKRKFSHTFYLKKIRG
jgi:hypothetical protein